MPAVSIVIPCYNGGRFLDALFNSIERQTFRDFETILVDDGSNDAQTIEKLKTLPASVQVIRQENRGLSSARNTGFYAAKAAIVLPLDCDDTLHPDHLAETVPVLLASSADVGFVYTDERLTGDVSGFFEHFYNRYDQLFVNRMSYCLLMRKEAWRKAGGYDEKMRDGYEDWEFNIRLGKCGYRGLKVAKPLLNYTVASTGMLMSKSSLKHAGLWLGIRRRHKDLYSAGSLYRLWKQEGTRLGLPYTMALLVAASILPSKWFGAGVHWMRKRKLAKRRKHMQDHTVTSPA
jgi:glycosyltransferase involved in cell wall biosynthesis